MEKTKKNEFIKFLLIFFIINTLSDYIIYYFDGFIMNQSQLLLFITLQFLGSFLGAYLFVQMKRYFIECKKN